MLVMMSDDDGHPGNYSMWSFVFTVIFWSIWCIFDTAKAADE